jgi:hypothetical protein
MTETEMDYKRLLQRYIAHVVDMEGTDFLDYPSHRKEPFTDEEMRQLREAAEE